MKNPGAGWRNARHAGRGHRTGVNTRSLLATRGTLPYESCVPAGRNDPGAAIVPNLWRDVEALMRLSRSARDLEEDGAVEAGGDEAGGESGLLPSSDRGTFQIATRELPARVVSGDLADAFDLPGGEVALVLA